MFNKDDLFDKEQIKYRNEARGFVDNQKKTEGLLKKAIKKANKKKGNLGEAWDKLQLFIELVKSYSKGDYRNVSTSTIVTVIGALLYFVSPLDLVPDFIVGLGILDDAAVIAYTIKKVSVELEEYNKWKMTSILPRENPLE